jgi:sugar/nucleoside kinase (ribokinase family)
MSPVVVFGSAHLDIYARPYETPFHFKDKPGDVSYSVGGSAFNVAKRLALLGEQVCIFTHLPRDSLISSVIQQEIVSVGIYDHYVTLDSRLRQSGFVAVLNGRRVEQAISCASIETAEFDRRKIENAVKSARFVVLDCNLSTEQIESISEISWSNGKEIVISPVSSAKAGRYLGVKPCMKQAFYLVSLNRAEAAHIIGEPPENIERSLGVSMLAQFRASNLVVSLGSAGHVAIDKWSITRFPAAQVNAVSGGSELGAGDALLAAHCACIRLGTSIDWNRAAALSRQLIADTFNYLSATPQTQCTEG